MLLFNSLPFIFVFLPVVLVVYFLLGPCTRFLSFLWCYIRASPESIWLAVVSVVFYAYSDSGSLILLFLSIILNYTAGYWIAATCSDWPATSRTILILAIIANLTVLGYYKYFMFLLGSVNYMGNAGLAVPTIVLPIGISFFTFTQIAFLADASQGKAKEYNFIHYLLFVTYFPHLIAGPILHHAQMMPQFKRESTYRINWENLSIGISFFVVGLVKKVFIADTCVYFATPIFNAASKGELIPFVDAWLGAFAYSLQLYFDFSGYCDMAVGASYMLNIRLPYNFNSPYKAVNIIDFWRRWHITLSSFLRDYLYIPLGGNRYGKGRRYLNLFITMLLGGLWHGAGWTFILWGALHGVYLMINHAFHAFRKSVGWKDNALGLPGRMFATVLTFAAVVLGWAIFRSENLKSVETMLYCMLGGNGFALTPRFLYYCKLHLHPLLIPGLIAIWALPNSQEWIGVSDKSESETGSIPSVPSWWRCVFLGTALGACLIKLLLDSLTGKTSEFLYYQF